MSHPATIKLGIATAAVLALPLVFVLGLAVVVASEEAPPDDASGMSCSVSKKDAEKLGLSKAQLKNAAAIYEVAFNKKMGQRAAVIGIATAIQESTLHNYGNLGDANDHDSLGLFQQRPSMGWGSPKQLTTPSYAAGKFFDSLKKVNGWKSLPLTVAAQAVQNSSFPDAYAQHEPKAKRIVDRLGQPSICTAGGNGKGWVAPVKAGIVSGYRTGERPDHDGIDFGAGRGTPIVAVNAGTVKTVLCNASTNNCDIDGSPSVMGCGWYVEIQHADKSVTRYCHMLEKPSLEVGQKVASGQKIGKVGSSGNSSGPHLHFEAHRNFPATSDNALEPRQYLKDRGVNVK